MSGPATEGSVQQRVHRMSVGHDERLVVIGWRSCLSWVTTIFISSVTVICRVLFCLACVSGVLFFLKRWKFFKNNFSFGLALQALLKTLVVCWLVRFLIVLANCVG
jgi:hypothetical protein